MITQLRGLVDEFGQVRHLLRKMSVQSDVPIEPQEQTRLLDACMSVPGVVMAGVPGGEFLHIARRRLTCLAAGGYDAIFCIVLSERAKVGVRKLWAEWTELSVGPLLARADVSQGAMEVDINAIPGLKQALSR